MGKCKACDKGRTINKVYNTTEHSKDKDCLISISYKNDNFVVTWETCPCCGGDYINCPYCTKKAMKEVFNDGK
jgi:hypothetical protein